MAKRITIMLDEDLLKKLHEIQAKQIKIFQKSVSFSAVLNEVIRKSLKWFWNYFFWKDKKRKKDFRWFYSSSGSGVTGHSETSAIS